MFSWNTVQYLWAPYFSRRLVLGKLKVSQHPLLSQKHFQLPAFLQARHCVKARFLFSLIWWQRRRYAVAFRSGSYDVQNRLILDTSSIFRQEVELASISVSIKLWKSIGTKHVYFMVFGWNRWWLWEISKMKNFYLHLWEVWKDDLVFV